MTTTATTTKKLKIIIIITNLAKMSSGKEGPLVARKFRPNHKRNKNFFAAAAINFM